MIGDPRTGTLGVDVGASNTTLGAAFNGKLQMTVRSDIGSAFGGLRLLKEVKIADVARWLPFQIQPTDLEAFVIDKELRPLTIPPDGRELLIEQALAREAIPLDREVGAAQLAAFSAAGARSGRADVRADRRRGSGHRARPPGRVRRRYCCWMRWSRSEYLNCCSTCMD